MDNFISFVAGLILGDCVGIAVMCLCVIAKKADKDIGMKDD